MSNQLILGLDFVSLILVVLSLVFLVKNRDYEKSVFENSINSLLFGMLLMILIKGIDILVLLNEANSSYVESIAPYVGSMATVSAIALLPLFGVCLLVSVIFAKDAFEQLDK